jgi:hypothetical protein
LREPRIALLLAPGLSETAVSRMLSRASAGLVEGRTVAIVRFAIALERDIESVFGPLDGSPLSGSSG